MKHNSLLFHQPDQTVSYKTFSACLLFRPQVE